MHIKYVLPTLMLLMLPFTALSQPVENIGPERLWITSPEGDSTCVPYATSRPLDHVHPDVTRALVFLPAGPRDVIMAGNQVHTQANQAGVMDTSIVCGLQFLYLFDLVAWELEDTKIAYWAANRMWFGYPSRTTNDAPRDFLASSFTFQDSFFVKIMEACPNLNTLVFMGNSEASKFVQHYGAATRLPLENPDWPPFLFCPMNTGSVFYPSPERMDLDGDIVIPNDVWQSYVPTYNDYPFGLDNPNPYVAETGPQVIHDEYPNRWFNHVVGAQDDGTHADYPAEAMQGIHNFMRTLVLIDVLNYHYGGLPRTNLYIVPGANHSNIWLFDEINEPLFYFTPPYDDN